MGQHERAGDDTAATGEEGLVLRFLQEVLGQRRLEVAAEVFSHDVLDHQAGEVVHGMRGLLQGVRRFLRAFPDLTIALNAMAVNAPIVMAWVTWRGTHSEAFMGIPATGRRVSVGCVTVFRAEAGQLAERWEFVDAPALFGQLGLPRRASPWSLIAPGDRPLLRIRW